MTVTLELFGRFARNDCENSEFGRGRFSESFAGFRGPRVRRAVIVFTGMCPVFAAYGS